MLDHKDVVLGVLLGEAHLWEGSQAVAYEWLQ
jgi:hypothetical protein